MKYPLHLVPTYGWFELMEELGGSFKSRFNGDTPQIEEITGYISGGGKAAIDMGCGYYQINSFGSRTIQLTESRVYSTGIRMGDIIVYKKDIERLEKLL